ncbi:MAG: DUF559 domain-containing protein [Caldilineaceae bacterium]
MKRVVRGQPVSQAKHEQARQLRQRMTPAERILWQALRKSQLDGYHFRRQQVIAGFIVDFYCHAVRLVIELDGAIHAQRSGHDAARDRILTQHGFHILRMNNATILENLPVALNQIRQTIRHIQV